MKVLIAAGGTAGHTIPALTIAEELREKDEELDILFVTSNKKQDKDLIRQKDFSLKVIFSGKLRRYFSFLNLIDPIFITLGFFQSLMIIFRFKPDVIFSKGGYVSLPVVLAGRILGKKILIHESDAVMGLANKISAKLANKVAVAFPKENYKNLSLKKIIYTGNPTRKLIKKEKRYDGKTILVMGGSQGARKINYTISRILQNLLALANVIHLVGESDFSRLEEERNKLKRNFKNKYKIFPNVFNESDFASLLSEADVVIGRAGASSIFEAALLSKALILIPLEGHQEVNAEYLEKHKAALVIKDKDFTPSRLKEKIFLLMDNSDTRMVLENNLSRFSSPKASEKITAELLFLSRR